MFLQADWLAVMILDKETELVWFDKHVKKSSTITPIKTTDGDGIEVKTINTSGSDFVVELDDGKRYLVK